LREVRTGAVVVVGLLLVGAGLGVLWHLIAPTVPLVVDENGELAFVDVSVPQEFIGSDGWFAVIAALAGLVTGIVVWGRARRQPFGALLGMAVGGVLASVVMWRVGVYLGPPELPSASDPNLAVGDMIEAPRRLGAKGLLALWPAVAVAIYLVLDLVTEDVPDDPAELSAPSVR
jgi:hypothetical protein